MLGRENTSKYLGLLLKSIFEYETVLQPTRDIVFWSLKMPQTIDPAFQLCKHQAEYFFLGKGKEELTRSFLVDVAQWWLSLPPTRTGVINPLLEWTLVQKDFVLDPFGELISSCILDAKVCNYNLSLDYLFAVVLSIPSAAY